MSVEQKRVVIIVGPGFEDVEALYPFYRLQEAGMRVDVVTSNNAEVHGKYGIPMKPTVQTTDLNAKDFCAVIIPGGTEGPDRVRQVGEIVFFVKDMYETKKVVSSICHGPWVLIEANIVRGKNATCYPGMKTDLKNAGAIYRAEPVVIDGNIVTSDHPRDLGPWMMETIALINQK